MNLTTAHEDVNNKELKEHFSELAVALTRGRKSTCAAT